MNIELGLAGRGRKRDREKCINGESDIGLESFGNGLGCKIDHWN